MDGPCGSRTGSLFGPYSVRSLLGRGGMGEVYEAYDTVKERTVALKVLPAHLAGDPRYALRFRRESQVAARLNDPHVIPIHDWGEIDGALFIDMRLVDGTSLGALLRSSGPLAPERAVAVVEQIASALDAAHRSGLVHRDIKPDNILLTPTDFAYLADFGIAYSEADTQLTTDGTVVGSYAYMAPERFGHGTIADAATDIYSLTCVLHQALTGGVPFDSLSIEQAISAHLHSPPPTPSAGRPWIPRSFDGVVARGMAKSPADRYRSAGDFARTARAALSGTAVGTAVVTVVGTTAPSPTLAAPRHSRPLAAAGPEPEPIVTSPPPAADRREATTILALLGVVILLVATAVGWLLLSRNTPDDSGAIAKTQVTAPVVSGSGQVDPAARQPASPAESPAGPESAMTAPDGCGTVRFPATGNTATLFVQSGPVTCPAAQSIFDRYLHDPTVEHTAGNTWPAEFDGWLCSIPTAASAAHSGSSGVCTNDEIGARIVARSSPQGNPEPEPTEPPATGTASLGGPGDLGLSTPMTVPTCTGSGIAVVANATSPGSYAEEIAGHLAAHPGASYLRTDRSCPSLRQATDEGNPIYTVYFPAGTAPSDVCAAVEARGADAYGKWLDTTTDPRSMIAC
ncbi:MAG: protein kinase [Rhodococcus sp. (in: high G+C Gram-positive bacteria)]